MKIKATFNRIKFRVQDRIELEKQAQNAARLVRQAKSGNGLTINLLVMQANEGSPLAHSALNHLIRELKAKQIQTKYDPKDDSVTIKYIGG